MKAISGRVVHDDFTPLVERLLASQALTQFQAEWIEAAWPNLGTNAFAHPHLQAVREHTRAYLEKAC